LDFEDEKEELSSFIIQYEKELQIENNNSNLSDLKNHNQNLATQIHQVV